MQTLEAPTRTGKGVGANVMQLPQEVRHQRIIDAGSTPPVILERLAALNLKPESFEGQTVGSVMYFTSECARGVASRPPRLNNK